MLDALLSIMAITGAFLVADAQPGFRRAGFLVWVISNLVFSFVFYLEARYWVSAMYLIFWFAALKGLWVNRKGGYSE